MKKLLVLVVVALSSCSSYRIEVKKTAMGTYYVPSQREGIDWVEHYSMFQNQKRAEQQIEEWKAEKTLQKNNKTQYIYFK